MCDQHGNINETSSSELGMEIEVTTNSIPQEISKVIKQRLIEANVPFFANDNIAAYLQTNELKLLQDEVQEKFQQVLESMVIDVENDHNSKDTAKRLAKMYLNEIFKGRYVPRPDVTDFPNAKHLDELYVVGPVTVRSSCSHHWGSCLGKAWIGVLPSDRVIGLSKFSRICDHIMSRPQIQEEATIQLADELEELIKPKGLAVIVEAQHNCMIMRGVKETETVMTTSVMRGELRNPTTKQEFLSLINRKD